MRGAESSPQRVGGGKETGKGSAGVGRAATVGERMVGKRSIGVPTYSCTVARKSYRAVLLPSPIWKSYKVESVSKGKCEKM